MYINVVFYEGKNLITKPVDIHTQIIILLYILLLFIMGVGC